jgi:hypothetical protein
MAELFADDSACPPLTEEFGSKSCRWKGVRTVFISAIAVIIPEKPRPTMAMRGIAEGFAAAAAFAEKSP